MARRRTGWEGGNLAVEIEEYEENEEREARSRVIERNHQWPPSMKRTQPERNRG
jgi:hypothetical protein